MSIIILFLTGFVCGFIFLAVVKLRSDSRKEANNKEFEMLKDKERTEIKQKRRTEIFDKNSKTLKRFKLSDSGQSYNACLNNKEIFVAFNFKYIDDPQFHSRSKNEMIEFDEISLSGIYEQTFAKILEKGELLVFSKTEGKLVNGIIRNDRGTYLSNQPDIPEFYDYYLPDGTLFFSVMNFHVYSGSLKRESSLAPNQNVKRWFDKFLP